MKTITKETLGHLRTSAEHDPLVVDVLPRRAFDKQHIPEAKNVPVAHRDFVQQVEDAAGDRERDVVVYCADDECHLSGKAARLLDSAGFSNVFDLEGGIEAWKGAGHPVAMGA